MQELRRRIYQKAKSEPTHRFWGLFSHITKLTTLHEAYQQERKNNGAPGIDGKSFIDIELEGVMPFLKNIQAELQAGTYQPQSNRKVEIPKANGKMRTLQIPCIRDRVVQGALKLILEAIFEANFCSNSYGFRSKRSSHQALAEVRRSILRRMTVVIDVDLLRYFDTIRHHMLLEKIAKRVQDSQVMHLVKQVIKVTGKIGVPQGGPFFPLAANIYLNEVDWTFDVIRRKTTENHYGAVNYHHFADDIVITVSGHSSKQGWVELALRRLWEQLKPLGVELNLEKTRMVNVLKGETFGFLGFDLRRVLNRNKSRHFVLITPEEDSLYESESENSRMNQTCRRQTCTRFSKTNQYGTDWVNYFRIGNSSRAFSQVRDYTEMKIRTLLTRRKRRQKRSIGWQRWSNEYLYGVLGLY
ncbi:group II intron reverse transcriptase/maturase [Bacillus cereus]|uniref:group II intron reverse transcriptase/maturase n=1 Tax=Bacillus cereus TaxID=1396 RepID=UPI0021164E96|nr:group II intron reverse transcriptase/maturase [Bacillus cereus]